MLQKNQKPIVEESFEKTGAEKKKKVFDVEAEEFVNMLNEVNT